MATPTHFPWNSSLLKHTGNFIKYFFDLCSFLFYLTKLWNLWLLLHTYQSCPVLLSHCFNPPSHLGNRIFLSGWVVGERSGWEVGDGDIICTTHVHWTLWWENYILQSNLSKFNQSEVTPVHAFPLYQLENEDICHFLKSVTLSTTTDMTTTSKWNSKFLFYFNLKKKWLINEKKNYLLI